MFDCICSETRFVMSDSVLGRLPHSEFELSLSLLKLVHDAKSSAGMVPPSPILSKNTSSSLEMAASCVGMVPPRDGLLERYKICKLDKELSNDVGMPPVSKLPRRERCFSRDREP